VTEGAILIGTIIFWNVAIDWLNYRVPALQDWLEAPPLLLVHNGRILHRHMRHEFVTEQELQSKLREHGVENLSEVAKAYMEADGSISVIKRP